MDTLGAALVLQCLTIGLCMRTVAVVRRAARRAGAGVGATARFCTACGARLEL